MALTIFRSNRVETLQARLAQRLVAAPLSDPFTPEIVVVPTYAMARWLNLSIARQQGVAANIRYPQAGDWLWSLATRLLDDLPQTDPCARAPLGWACFDALPELLERPAFAALRQYLDDDDSGIKRWQLCQRIADCFDRYQSFRPEMIRAWSNGEQDDWQALLWRRVVTERGLSHRVEILRALRRRLESRLPESALPERVSLFALSRLAPAWFEIIHALAARSEVLLFQHNPTDQYWADLVSEKQQARERLRNPRHGDYHDSGNHLLTSWGRQGQSMQDLLIDLEAVTGAEFEDNQAPESTDLLRSLQASLFHLEQPRIELADGDDSVSVQLCHSPLRECQVLHDRLLALLDRHPELSSEDILVMVPDISRYAAYIEAVFQPDTSHRRPDLGWNISDISVADGHPLVRVFLQLLNLPGCRFTRSEILSFLECDEIRMAFGIDASMLEDIYRLVERARVRWGIDAGQRGELGLPRTHENTWQQAWERVFAGYAMPDDGAWGEIAPISEVDADSGIAVARFRRLFERLVYWRQRLAGAVGSSAWQQRLHQLVDEFLAPRTGEDESLQPLRNAIGELAQTESRELGPDLLRFWMEQQLATRQQPGRLYSGGVTFCGMQPMRNIPFPVICVLGMQDRDFPRRERPPEFDRMRDQWRAGDPHHGDEDRYLMLETLLCARRYLYFSYCARSLKDNSECQPSVLLRELLDYIDNHVVSGEGVASERISRLHPMQPFSVKNYTAEAPGYDPHWFDTACLVADAPARPTFIESWHREALPGADAEAATTIDLESLLRFFQHPPRFFYRNRLGINIARQNPLEDEEAFELEGLHQWSVVEQLARQYLDGAPLRRQLYSARGLLPHGYAADAEWLRLLSDYRDLFDRLTPYNDVEPEEVLVDCELGEGARLYGEVRDWYPGLGLMHFSASKRVKGAALIALWLNHLALCASGGHDQAQPSQLFAASTRGWQFDPTDAADARQLLLSYVELYREGQHYPLPLFPQTSYAWVFAGDPERAGGEAANAWYGSERSPVPGESTDAYIRLALHNNPGDPLEDETFQRLARQVFVPAQERGKEID